MSMRWDPFRDAVSLREAMDRLLEESFIHPRGGQRSGRGAQTLPIDMWEATDRLMVRVALPGAKPEAEDVSITVDRNILAIRVRLPGVADEESEDKGSGERGHQIRWLYRELPRGEFSRTVELPIEVDAENAHAHFGDGLLLLTLPKAQAARPRQIKVTPGGGQSGDSEPSGQERQADQARERSSEAQARSTAQ
jgi:HSP20 family protein